MTWPWMRCTLDTGAESQCAVQLRSVSDDGPQTSGEGTLVYRHVAGGCIQWMFDQVQFFFIPRDKYLKSYTSELNTVRPVYTKCTKSILSIQNSKVFNININV